MSTPTTPEALAEMVAEHFAKTPTEPLIIFNLMEELYRGAPGENISALKLLGESAKDYDYFQKNPITPTDDMILGTVIHFLVLQPHRPESECFQISPYPDFRTKAAQEWRDSQTLPILDQKKLTLARETAAAITAHPRVAWLLKHRRKDGSVFTAQTEVSAFRRHERTGLLLKGRADIVSEDEEGNTVICDLKKVQSVKPNLFAKDIGERGHWVSAAFYNDFFGASFHCLIPAKVGPPPDVDVRLLDKCELDAGTTYYEKLLDRLVKCRASNSWAGVSENDDALKTISVPSWALKQAEEFVP